MTCYRLAVIVSIIILGCSCERRKRAATDAGIVQQYSLKNTWYVLSAYRKTNGKWPAVIPPSGDSETVAWQNSLRYFRPPAEVSETWIILATQLFSDQGDQTTLRIGAYHAVCYINGSTESLPLVEFERRILEQQK